MLNRKQDAHKLNDRAGRPGSIFALEQFVLAAEISYDLVMDEDMAFVEGSYRLPGGNWHVLIVSRYEGTKLQAVPQIWESGVSGMVLLFPHSARIDRAAVERVLSASVGVWEWVVVRGPDSMQLRSQCQDKNSDYALGNSE